jgi:hypothetical protein
MRVLGSSLLRVIAIALLAYGAVVAGDASQLPWLGWAFALLLLLAYLIFIVVHSQKRAAQRREAAWEHAIYDARKRPAAILELTRALQKLTPVRPGSRRAHARLSVLLSELHDAQGEHAAAVRVIDQVPLTALSALDVALVRHTRAVTHLRAGDAPSALTVLAPREPSGDLELDQRLSLLEAYAQVECGEPKRGMQRAEEIAQLEGTDESVRTEARVVRAAGLDALGRREEALVVLAALGRESLLPLSELGQPRVRELAKRILEGVAM